MTRAGGGRGSTPRGGGGRRAGGGRGGASRGERPGEDRPARGGPVGGGGRARGPADAPRDRGDVVYGRNPVREALRAGRRRVRRVWATPAAAREAWLAGAPVTVTDDVGEIARRAGSDAHQGVVAAVDPYPYADAGDLLAVDDALIVALDEVQDPQNLGAIARTAECAGATGLIIPERRSAEVTAAAAKASAGAVEHLPVARVRNLADLLAEAKRAGFWVYGADGSAPTSYTEIDYSGPVVLVLGAEGTGIRPRVRSHCDALVRLPLRGRVASLNVSAAAAVLLYEAVRSRTS